mmetsp:Transcript_13137/g.23855  ORF Transcript_13137/g.23855 Transcript_13137/m.23855 type:complete len:696 (+) Transcript_13137:77-2164(+)
MAADDPLASGDFDESGMPSYDVSFDAQSNDIHGGGGSEVDTLRKTNAKLREQLKAALSSDGGGQMVNRLKKSNAKLRNQLKEMTRVMDVDIRRRAVKKGKKNVNLNIDRSQDPHALATRLASAEKRMNLYKVQVEKLKRQLSKSKPELVVSLENRIYEKQIEIKKLKEENKMLKKDNWLLKKAINSHQDDHSNITCHFRDQQKELRIYKEKFRKYKEKCEEQERTSRKQREHAGKMAERYRKLKTKMQSRLEKNKASGGTAQNAQVEELKKSLAEAQKVRISEKKIFRRVMKINEKQIAKQADEIKYLNERLQEKDHDIRLEAVRWKSKMSHKVKEKDAEIRLLALRIKEVRKLAVPTNGLAPLPSKKEQSPYLRTKIMKKPKKTSYGRKKATHVQREIASKQVSAKEAAVKEAASKRAAAAAAKEVASKTNAESETLIETRKVESVKDDRIEDNIITPPPEDSFAAPEPEPELELKPEPESEERFTAPQREEKVAPTPEESVVIPQDNVTVPEAERAVIPEDNAPVSVPETDVCNVPSSEASFAKVDAALPADEEIIAAIHAPLAPPTPAKEDIVEAAVKNEVQVQQSPTPDKNDIDSGIDATQNADGVGLAAGETDKKEAVIVGDTADLGTTPNTYNGVGRDKIEENQEPEPVGYTTPELEPAGDDIAIPVGNQEKADDDYTVSDYDDSFADM